MSTKLTAIQRLTDDAMRYADPYDYLADLERKGEISLSEYYNACRVIGGLSRSQANWHLRRNYDLEGVVQRL